MKLTLALVRAAGTAGCGFNFHQLYLLGIQWPPKHGWMHRLVGMEIEEEKWELVKAIGNRPRMERLRLIREFNDRQGKLFEPIEPAPRARCNRELRFLGEGI